MLNTCPTPAVAPVSVKRLATEIHHNRIERLNEQLKDELKMVTFI